MAATALSYSLRSAQVNDWGLLRAEAMGSTLGLRGEARALFGSPKSSLKFSGRRSCPTTCEAMWAGDVVLNRVRLPDRRSRHTNDAHLRLPHEITVTRMVQPVPYKVSKLRTRGQPRCQAIGGGRLAPPGQSSLLKSFVLRSPGTTFERCRAASQPMCMHLRWLPGQGVGRHGRATQKPVQHSEARMAGGKNVASPSRYNNSFTSVLARDSRSSYRIFSAADDAGGKKR